MLPHVEALAATAEQIFAGHNQVFDLDFGMGATHFQTDFGVRLHGLDVAQNLVAR